MMITHIPQDDNLLVLFLKIPFDSFFIENGPKFRDKKLNKLKTKQVNLGVITPSSAITTWRGQVRVSENYMNA